MKGREISTTGTREEQHRSNTTWADVTGAWLVVAVLFVMLLVAW